MKYLLWTTYKRKFPASKSRGKQATRNLVNLPSSQVRRSSQQDSQPDRFNNFQAANPTRSEQSKQLRTQTPTQKSQALQQTTEQNQAPGERSSEGYRQIETAPGTMVCSQSGACGAGCPRCLRRQDSGSMGGESDRLGDGSLVPMGEHEAPGVEPAHAGGESGEPRLQHDAHGAEDERQELHYEPAVLLITEHHPSRSVPLNRPNLSNHNHRSTRPA